jgi:hypothetical protein
MDKMKGERKIKAQMEKLNKRKIIKMTNGEDEKEKAQ